MNLILETGSIHYFPMDQSGMTLASLQQDCIDQNIKSESHGTAEGESRIVLVAADVPHPQSGVPCFRLSESHIHDIDATGFATVDDFNMSLDLKIAAGPGFFILTQPGKLVGPFIPQ